MSLPELAVPVASVATLGVTLRYGSDAVLRLVAGITAIAAKDNRTRAERALDVLRLLRRGSQPPPEDGSPD
jgi:hypothetical protein